MLKSPSTRTSLQYVRPLNIENGHLAEPQSGAAKRLRRMSFFKVLRVATYETLKTLSIVTPQSGVTTARF